MTSHVQYMYKNVMSLDNGNYEQITILILIRLCVTVDVAKQKPAHYQAQRNFMSFSSNFVKI